MDKEPNDSKPKVEEQANRSQSDSDNESCSHSHSDQQHYGQEKIQEKGEKGNDTETKLSKKQLKKLQKRQKWDQIKRQKRKEQREKQKQKRRLKREQMIQNGQIDPQEKKQQPQGQAAHKKRKQQYKQKMLDGQKVVIDLQFYDLMVQKQQTSLGKQLAYCHSVNRKAVKCFNFILTSATEKRMKLLNQKYNVENFGITIVEADVLEAFDKAKLVYLTGDAQQQLAQLSPDEIYIIGGIVDHNRLKNITIDYANAHEIRARRLPMGGLKLKASVHLAVNHVWEWMLRYYNGSTWKEAIQAVIPERKLQDMGEGKMQGQDEK